MAAARGTTSAEPISNDASSVLDGGAAATAAWLVLRRAGPGAALAPPRLEPGPERLALLSLFIDVCTSRRGRTPGSARVPARARRRAVARDAS